MAASTAAQSIIVNAGVSVPVNALIIDNHNLAGKALQLRASTDNFVTSDVLIVGWTQADNSNILKRFTLVNYQYWKLVILSGSPAASIGEIYLGVRVQLPKNPAIPFDPESETDFSRQGFTPFGYLYQREDYRRDYFDLNFPPLTLGQDQIFINWWQECTCLKPFYFCFKPETEPEDVILVRNESQFSAIMSNSVRIGRRMLLREVF